jgi:glutamine---fructose-6-phosphate transaminase (isomerizing)
MSPTPASAVARLLESKPRTPSPSIVMKRNAYDDQLASMPQVVAQLLAQADYPGLDLSRPIIFSGIGTSLHAAKVAADWIAQLSQGRHRAFAVDAHDIGSGHYPLTQSDQLIVISHRGKKIYPNATLRRAKSLGCATISIVGTSAPVQDADLTIRTCANETAGTFSVSYLASLAVLLELVANTFPSESVSLRQAMEKLPASIEASLAMKTPKRWVEGFALKTPILISGFGSDFPTAQEAALKIKEGAWLWTEAMSPEFAIHGTPASYHAAMSGIVMMPDSDDGGRSKQLHSILSQLGMQTVASCGPAGQACDLQFAEPPHALLRPFLSILPFHLLTSALAQQLSTDPDTLHGHREPWKTVMTGLTL